MILCNTECVRTALKLTASVYALPHAFADLETNLLRLAIKIIGAVSFEVTSFDQIMRISNVS